MDKKDKKDFIDFELKVKSNITKKDLEEFDEKSNTFSLKNMNDEALAIVARIAGIPFKIAKAAQIAYATKVDSLDIPLEPLSPEKAGDGTVMDVMDPMETIDPYLLATPTLEEQLEQTERKQLVARMLKSLPPREEKILRLRFGLEDGTPKTLEEIGKVFHITRERIRQIEAKALTTLRKRIKSGIFGDII